MLAIFGYLALLLCNFLQASSLAFIKAYETYDGIIFAWWQGAGMLMGGLVSAGYLCIQGSGFTSTLYLCNSGLIQGAIIGLSNSLFPKIVDLCGLSVGCLTWQCVATLFGWAMGRFGWFGVPPEIVHNQFLNVFGLMLCIVGQLLMFFVEPPADTKVKLGTDDEDEYDSKPLTKDGSKLTVNINDVPDSKSSEMTPLIITDSSSLTDSARRRRAKSSGPSTSLTDSVSRRRARSTGDIKKDAPVEISFIRSRVVTEELDNLKYTMAFPNFTPSKKPKSFWMGIALATFAGVVSAVPSAFYLKWIEFSGLTGDKYAISQIMGLYLGNTILFMAKGAHAQITSQVWLKPAMRPAFVSGFLYGVGYGFYYISLITVPWIIAFPMYTIGQLTFTAIFSLLYFREIQGFASTTFFSAGFLSLAGGMSLLILSDLI